MAKKKIEVIEAAEKWLIRGFVSDISGESAAVVLFGLEELDKQLAENFIMIVSALYNEMKRHAANADNMYLKLMSENRSARL